jgi:hypothetical protein
MRHMPRMSGENGIPGRVRPQRLHLRVGQHHPMMFWLRHASLLSSAAGLAADQIYVASMGYPLPTLVSGPGRNI